MARLLVSDELWELVEPLIPKVPSYERRDDIHEAFLAIGCSLICLKLLHQENSF